MENYHCLKLLTIANQNTKIGYKLLLEKQIIQRDLKVAYFR